jgi:hypothetical protein
VEHFPNLKNFVLSLYFYFRLNTDAHKQHFKEEVLGIRNFRRANSGLGWEYITIEDTVIELLAALAQSGRGVRKLVRFGHGRDSSNRHVGPMIKISNSSAHASELSVASDADDKIVRKRNLSIANARNIFIQAYHAPRTARIRYP